MTTSQAISRGLEITAQISALKAELADIESKLETIALHAEHLPLNEADREGRQAILHGDGVTLPVVFESDLVAATLPDPGPAIGIIRSVVKDPAVMVQLWKPASALTRVAKDGQKYRQQLRGLLSPEDAATVLRASIQRDKTGIPKSRTIIAWDRVASA